MIKFDWNEDKNRANRKKHGVWFEEAQSAFDDVRGRLFLDSDHSAEEDRFILIGYNSSNRLLVVVHCHRESDDLVIRIISARKATKRERQYYEKGI